MCEFCGVGGLCGVCGRDTRGASVAACRAADAVLMLDGLRPVRDGLRAGSYDLEAFAADVARVIDREFRLADRVA